jgi:hypothetical protein
MKNNSIKRLFTESLQPSIPNGQTLRRFKRVVLSKVDSVGLIEALQNNSDRPYELLLGTQIVMVDNKGQARVVALPYAAETYNLSG